MNNENQPIKPFPNGRGADGRFTVGNSGGPGNPNTRRAAEMREWLSEWTTKGQLRKIWKKLLAMAKAGDVAAIKLVLDRTLGVCKPAPDEDQQPIEEIHVTVSVQPGGLTDSELAACSGKSAAAPDDTAGLV